MLRLSAISHRYDGQQVVSLDAWHAKAGERWLVLGASGSGKTTLLHIMAGLLRPSAGSVSVDERDLGAMPAGMRDKFRGRSIGIVFQQLHLIDALTVAQNMMLAQRLAGLAPDATRAADVLNALDLAAKGNAYPDQLSFGQAQRAALGRALINRPKILLADEPTSNLDDRNADNVIELLISQAQETNALLVVATHDARVKSRFDSRLDLDMG